MRASLQSAWDVHRTIDRRLRESSEPIIRSVPDKRLLRRVGDDYLQRLDRFQSAMSAISGPGPWHSIGNVILGFSEHGFLSSASKLRLDPESVAASEHESLLQQIEDGFVPRRVQETDERDFSSEAIARKRITALARFAVDGRETQAKAAAFAVANEIVKSRLATTVLHVTGQFIVPDPFTTEGPPSILDQLWIARADGERVRLINLEIDGEQHLTREEETQDRERDAILAALGYEVFRAAGWWARVDPPRVIRSFLEAAGIPYLKRVELAIPGPRIDDYRCASCRQPMIRTDDGYGIVQHKGLCIHEECYDRVVDEGEFDWIE